MSIELNTVRYKGIKTGDKSIGLMNGLLIIF